VSDEATQAETEDADALAARARDLTTQLRVLRMRAESANFENREAYRRAINEKEAAIAQLKEQAELAAVDVDIEIE
jgi:hypothetical protein